MTEHLTRVKVTATIFVDLATDSHPEDIDDKLVRDMVIDNVADFLQNADPREAAESMVDSYEFDNVEVITPETTCSICGKPCDGNKAHLHQGAYIGDECCWDDRLKSSE
jgi:hypothetical protein